MFTAWADHCLTKNISLNTPLTLTRVTVTISTITITQTSPFPCINITPCSHPAITVTDPTTTHECTVKCLQ